MHLLTSVLLQNRLKLVEIQIQSLYLYSYVISRLISLTVILFSFLLISIQTVCAQQHFSQNNSAHQKEIWFDNLVGFENSGIINGPEYFIALQGTNTHPFYGSRDLSLESVVFNGQRYSNVALMYDIYSDILILRHRDKNGIFVLIELAKENVDGFTLYGHQFKKLSKVSLDGKIQSPQFYDILLDGEVMDLIAKRKKTTHVVGSRPEYQYDEKFYFLKNNELIPITRKKNIYAAFPRSVKSIQEYINKNKLNIRNEKDLLLISRFCDSLNRDLNK